MVKAELVKRFLWKCGKCNKEYKSTWIKSGFYGADVCCDILQKKEEK